MAGEMERAAGTMVGLSDEQVLAAIARGEHLALRVLYDRYAGAVFSLKYHVVFCPKYRRPVLTPPIDQRLKEVLTETAEAHGIDVPRHRGHARPRASTRRGRPDAVRGRDRQPPEGAQQPRPA